MFKEGLLGEDRKMARQRAKIDKKYLIALAILLVAMLVLSAAIGKMWGNEKTGQTPSNTNTNTVEPGGNTDPGNNGDPNGNDPDSNTNSGTNADPGTNTDPKSDPVAEAAKKQDYTIDPKTGMAKEIKMPDDNYLLLINRTHPLAETYVPDDMVTVKSVVSGVGVKGETDQLRKVAAEAFEAMVEAAAADEINIKMRTGYRSFAYQRDRLYNVYVKNHGQEYADTISAKPGQSEHQTGLALDVGGESQKYALSSGFGDTKEGKWVAEHCHEYGFIIRYTDGTRDKPGATTGFVSEPWHLRYVGVEPATAMYKSGQLLEEYLGVLD